MQFSLYKIIAVLSLCSQLESRKINQAGLNLIKEFEGFRANFYGDPVGIRTIGYGHACHANDCSSINPPITEAQGEALLRQDVVRFENCVTNSVNSGVNVDDNMFSAVVSFAFNLGCGNVDGVMSYVNNGDVYGASKQFGKYVNAGGKPLPGLVRRREAERKLFCSLAGC